jgi:hypothetical protein
MSKVLILGNSNDRVKFKDFVRAFDEERWGCNFVFCDRSLPKLDLMMGDYTSVINAVEYRGEFGAKFKICARLDLKNLLNDYPIDCYIDSTYNIATSLAEKAVQAGYDEIYICGVDVENWLADWNAFYKRYGLDRITFLSTMKDYEYLIKQFIPVTLTPNTLHREKKVLILGNGVSRKEEPDKTFISNWADEIWGCNGAFVEEDIPFTRIGSLHSFMAEKMVLYKKRYKKEWRIFSKKGMPGVEEFYYALRGGNTGYQWILQALYENFDKIYLSGFDFGGPDLYTETKTGKAFQQRFKQVMEEFGLNRIYFVRGFPQFLC